jgi:geranylgeranyl pyrophosphate synthase
MTFIEYLAAVKPMVDLRIDDLLCADLHDSPHLLEQLIRGKRLRAGVLIFTYQAFSDEIEIPEQVLDLAVAIELAHGVSLIIDDMIDEDETRRGVIAHHLSKGHKRAMLDSVGLLSMPYDLAVLSGPEYVHSLAKTQRSMVKGVIREMFKGESLPATALYDAIITKKTGDLFALAAYWGTPKCWNTGHCMSNEQWALSLKTMTEWGLHVGKAMQAADDIADLKAVIEGRKKGQLGTEALLLRCLTTDRLAHELIADVKAGSLHLGKARELWNSAGVQKSLHVKLDEEIDAASITIAHCPDLWDKLKQQFYPIAREIADIMLKEE